MLAATTPRAQGPALSARQPGGQAAEPPITAPASTHAAPAPGRCAAGTNARTARGAAHREHGAIRDAHRAVLADLADDQEDEACVDQYMVMLFMRQRASGPRARVGHRWSPG